MFINTLKFISLCSISILISCSPTTTIKDSDATLPFEPIKEVYYEFPVELKDRYLKIETIAEYRHFLNGVKVFIDPGHGGDDKRNRSITGKIIEAEINLRVALFLKEFLEEAGAIVSMSRDGDDTIDLEQRAALANENEADIFISIHHNASTTKGNFWTNYTSTFYHSKNGENNYEPSSRDLARYIQRDLSYAMRNPGGLISFDGTVSDYVVFPGEGFYVLRKTEMTSVLIECGFLTNRMEEERLAIEEFNEIQAWGIFSGIARYFMAGVPKINILMEQSILSGNELNLVFEIEDRFEIDPESIDVFFDSIKADYEFKVLENLLYVNISGVAKGEHEIRIICTNKNGNHSFPYKKKLILK